MTIKAAVGSLAVVAAICFSACAVRPGPGRTCYYGGTPYSDGAAACQSGAQFRCNNGNWRSLGYTCADDSMAMNTTGCMFGGRGFLAGSTSCQNGLQYRCDGNGLWTNLGAACIAGDNPLPPGGRTCMISDATVASNSSICRQGHTYLCSDGQWINLNTPCR